MIYPGDIVEVKGVDIHCDPRGFTWYRTSNNKTVKMCHRLNKDDYNRIYDTIMFKSKPFELVCVPGQDNGCSLVSLYGYESALLKFYYNRNGNIKKNAIKLFADKWRRFDCFSDVINIHYSHRSKEIQDNNIYYVVENKRKWIIPLSASKYCQTMPKNTRSLFCPTPPYHMNKNQLKSIYCSDYADCPAYLNGEFEFSNNLYENKKCDIILHGFLQPERWHYKFWKHVVSGTDTADEVEHTQWVKIFQSTLPDKSVFNESGCKECVIDSSKRIGCCAPCDIDHFGKIHKLAGQALQEYLGKIVTFFLKAQTKEIRWKRAVGNTTLINVTVAGSSENGFYPYLFMRGASYDWDVQIPTIYLYPITYYFRRSCHYLWPETNYEYRQDWQRGRFYNVKRKN